MRKDILKVNKVVYKYYLLLFLLFPSAFFVKRLFKTVEYNNNNIPSVDSTNEFKTVG